MGPERTEAVDHLKSADEALVIETPNSRHHDDRKGE
jgi:hypothetical protein